MTQDRLSASTSSSSGARLKARLAEDRILLAPGVADGLSALMAKQAGAEALYLSGASIAYTRFGAPDLGLVDMNEAAAVLEAVSESAGLPIIADADTGFGNALNVQRTVRRFERAGAAAVQLEDQTLPKRCGHLAGKTLVSRGEMVGKIRAALDARVSSDTLICARTDAIAVEGFDAALMRAEAYLEAGADILFVEAPRNKEQMLAIMDRFHGRAPMLANIVEGGATPPMSAAELQELGYRIAIFPGGYVRAIAQAGQAYYQSLIAAGGTGPFQDRMLDFAGLNAVLGTPEILTNARKYDGAENGDGKDDVS